MRAGTGAGHRRLRRSSQQTTAGREKSGPENWASAAIPAPMGEGFKGGERQSRRGGEGAMAQKAGKVDGRETGGGRWGSTTKHGASGGLGASSKVEPGAGRESGL
jgi:hypothetical protein